MSLERKLIYGTTRRDRRARTAYRRLPSHSQRARAWCAAVRCGCGLPRARERGRRAGTRRSRARLLRCCLLPSQRSRTCTHQVSRVGVGFAPRTCRNNANARCQARRQGIKPKKKKKKKTGQRRVGVLNSEPLLSR